jgi:hypothetical protein
LMYNETPFCCSFVAFKINMFIKQLFSLYHSNSIQFNLFIKRLFTVRP